MIMTPSTVDGQTKDRLSGCRNDVVQIVIVRKFRICWLVVPTTETIVSCRDNLIRSLVRQFVTGKLLRDELIIRLVIIE